MNEKKKINIYNRTFEDKDKFKLTESLFFLYYNVLHIISLGDILLNT